MAERIRHLQQWKDVVAKTNEPEISGQAERGNVFLQLIEVPVIQDRSCHQENRVGIVAAYGCSRPRQNLVSLNRLDRADIDDQMRGCLQAVTGAKMRSLPSCRNLAHFD